MVKTPDVIFRDFETDGVPSSGAHNPIKVDIRDWANNIQSQLLAIQTTPIVPNGDAHSLSKSGRYYGNSATANAPDNLYDYWYKVVGNGSSYANVEAVAVANPFRKWQTSLRDGSWDAWTEINGKDIRFDGALADGSTPCQNAISLCVARQIANVNTSADYAAMPQAAVCEVFIPAGAWNLSGQVSTFGRAVTYVVDEAARFTPGSAAFLKGRVVRPNRASYANPFGLLDHACGDSVMVGEGSFDNSPLVTGFTNPNQIASNSTIDLVGRYTDVTSPALIHNSSATFTSTSCVLSSPVDPNLLRVGMVVQTTNTPFERGQITDWSSDGVTVQVGNGWFAQNSTTPTTPNSANVIFNPFHKLWAQNSNFFMIPSGYAFQATANEIGMWNNKVTPASAVDSAGRTWGEDTVNLGPRKVSVGFIARGSMYEGFRSSGTDIGFNATDYADLGYGSPSVGFNYSGNGASLASFNSSGLNSFYLTPSQMEFGVQGASNTPTISFHSGNFAATYDCAIRATGGDGVTGNGTLNLLALLTLANNLRPSLDNSYQLGGSSNRWSVVFSATGTINTSDPKLKRFYDTFNKKKNDEIFAKLKKAINNLPIRLYQWLDAIEEKGDNARLHVGLSAQEVFEVFEKEGLDAHEFGLFCEDDEIERVSIKEKVNRPIKEKIKKKRTVYEEKEDCVVCKVIEEEIEISKTVKKALLNEDGSPAMRDIQKQDEHGNPLFFESEDGRKIPIIIQSPAFLEVELMQEEEIEKWIERPTGNKRLGLRYDQLTLLMIAALKESN